MMTTWSGPMLSAKVALERLWFWLLSRLPLPSEHKWRGMEELFAFAFGATLEAPRSRRSEPLGTFHQALERAGSRWMRPRAEWLSESLEPVSGIQTLMVQAFKTLNMPTKVRVQGSGIRAVTFRCPFVEQAASGESAKRICTAICAHQRSLFHGLVLGLPLVVAYLAPQKMGWGDSECVKEFHILEVPRQVSLDSDARQEAGSGGKPAPIDALPESARPRLRR